MTLTLLFLAQTLPKMPVDPAAIARSWDVLVFIVGVILFLVIVLTALLKARVVLDQVISTSTAPINRQLEKLCDEVGHISSRMGEMGLKLHDFDRDSQALAAAIHRLSETLTRTDDRMDRVRDTVTELSAQVTELKAKLSRIEGVAKNEGRT